MFKRSWCLCSVLLAHLGAAQIPCDDQFGAFCPEASGWSVGDCLKEHPDQLPAACLSFIGTMDSCHSDIDSFCAGKEYSGEVISCLLDWTSPDKLDPACLVALEAFRPKAKTEQKKQSKEDREKANKRRKVRQEAARRAGREL